MNMRPAKVTLPSEVEVKVTRTFDAPARLVWRAYTEPDLLKRWMLGPPGWVMPICEVDFKLGGGYRWRWRNVESGREFGFHGVYLRIKPNAEMVHTQEFDPGTVGGNMANTAVGSISFEEANGQTAMVTVIKFQSVEDRDAALSTGMTDGMEVSYWLLDAMIAETTAGKERGDA
jgi:uncharacterized protein YndB with AHSA1/START domain